MANELKLPYVRFVRQVQSTSKAIVQWKSTMAETLEALKIAPWNQASVAISDVSMPVNAPLTFTPSDAFDAFKMSSTVAGSGKQTCHMGMVAYRYTIPADAITDSTHPTAVTLSLGADKFNTSGLRVALYLSNTATPPTDWTVCREGTEFIPDETIDTVTLGILASRSLTVSGAVNAAGSYTVTFDPAITANNAYLYVIISNYNYADFRASREYYIEGSGVLDGANVQVSFEAAVTADTSTQTSVSKMYTSGLLTWGADLANTSIYHFFNIFPGGGTAAIAAKTSGTYPIFAMTNGTGAKIQALIFNGPLKTKNTPFYKMKIASLVANLTAHDTSLLVTVWAGLPAIDSTGTLYCRFASISTSNAPSIMATLGHGGADFALKVTVSGVTPDQTINLKQVGQAVLQKGKAYDGDSVVPVFIDNEIGKVLSVVVVIIPFEMGVASTTDLTGAFPSENLFYFS